MNLNPLLSAAGLMSYRLRVRFRPPLANYNCTFHVHVKISQSTKTAKGARKQERSPITRARQPILSMLSDRGLVHRYMYKRNLTSQVSVFPQDHSCLWAAKHLACQNNPGAHGGSLVVCKSSGDNGPPTVVGMSTVDAWYYKSLMVFNSPYRVLQGASQIDTCDVARGAYRQYNDLDSPWPGPMLFTAVLQ